MNTIDRCAVATRRLAALLVLAGVAFAVAAVPASATGDDLEGVIHLDEGVETDFPFVPAGSWVRIQQPGNEITAPFLENSWSENHDDLTYTLLEPGAEELELGQYQTTPGDIVTPRAWEGVPFDIRTLAADPTEEKEGTFPPPSLEHDAGHVTGDFSSWTVLWGTDEAGYWYSQGADSEEPGDIHHPDHNLEGTYDEETGHIKLNWSSVILDHYPPPGGGFNGFRGYWQLEGTFEPEE